MTEGITLSLYLLFLVSFLQSLSKDRKKKDLLYLGLVLFLLISTRKQLLSCVILVLGVSLLRDLFYLKNLRRFFTIAGVTGLALLTSSLFDYSYNYSVRGIWMSHTGNSMSICSKLFYTAEEEDAETLQPEDAALFTEIVRRAKQQGAHWSNLPDDATPSTRTAHYTVSYDIIGYDIMNDVLDEAFHRTGQEFLPYARRLQAADVLEQRFAKALLRQSPRRSFSLTIMLIKMGLLNSIARDGGMVHALAGLCLYIVYCFLFLKLYHQEKAAVLADSRRFADNNRQRILLLAALIILSVICNVLVTSAVIYPQTRYTIYTMGVFYTALALLFSEVVLRYN